jgi:hypothetical protein
MGITRFQLSGINDRRRFGNFKTNVAGTFPLGNQSALDLVAFGDSVVNFEPVSPSAGGVLTINSQAVGLYDLCILKGNQTVSSFTASDFFTTTADRSGIIIIDGDLTINSGQTFIPSVRKLFTFLYVTGAIINNGTVSMSLRGANHSGTGSSGGATTAAAIRIATGTFGGVTNPEIPASGGTGGAGVSDGTGSGGQSSGNTGATGTNGGTGGGGSGAARRDNASFSAVSGAGASGTSFSGGAGSGAAMTTTTASVSSSAGGANGGAGSNGVRTGNNSNAGGGAGNPGGSGTADGGFTGNVGGTGIGGVLIVYSPISITGSGTFVGAGAAGGNASNVGGAGSGGGSVTLISPSSSGVTVSAAGGAGGSTGGGAGGAGTARNLIG